MKNIIIVLKKNRPSRNIPWCFVKRKLLILTTVVLSIIATGCGSPKLEKALHQEELADIRSRLENSGISVEFANLPRRTVAQVIRDRSGNATTIQINNGLSNAPVEVIKQHIAHEDVHAASPDGRNPFPEERDARVQEADIWRTTKGALRNIVCDDNENLIYDNNGNRRSDAEIRRRLRVQYGYPY